MPSMRSLRVSTRRQFWGGDWNQTMAGANNGGTVIDNSGVITVRYDSQLRHIGLGRAHRGTHVIALIADRYVRVINADTGELLRELTIDPNRDYQPRKPA